LKLLNPELKIGVSQIYIMATDLKQIGQKAEDKMQASVEFLGETLSRIRAGKANPHILDGIKLEYYGSLTPLSGVAAINTPDARTIVIQPWEKQMLKEVEKAILNSDVGITPDNNGEIIRLSIPPLTEERRKQLVKQVKQEVEEAKVSIRNARRDAIDSIKKSVKDGVAEDMAKDAENDMQKLHDRYIKKIDEVFVLKEKEILTV
jgi:ribosome recycling factor